ncbi:uncharacterized protein VTP21DRAFT_1846 [Calcarisporiella thermophila]|uniref:uncharacterized protein n=1 Tax=Calcarisporiella thermophila TaxID=911321 RepID=UPI003743B115
MHSTCVSLCSKEKKTLWPKNFISYGHYFSLFSSSLSLFFAGSGRAYIEKCPSGRSAYHRDRGRSNKGSGSGSGEVLPF